MTQPVVPALTPLPVPVSATPSVPARRPWSSEFVSRLTADTKPAAPATPTMTMGSAASRAFGDAIVAALSSGVFAVAAARDSSLDAWSTVGAFATHVLAAPYAPRVSRAAGVVMLMGVGSMVWRRMYSASARQDKKA